MASETLDPITAEQQAAEEEEAATLLQRTWRVKKYNWLYGAPNVRLPPSPDEGPKIPSSWKFTASPDLAAASGCKATALSGQMEKVCSSVKAAAAREGKTLERLFREQDKDKSGEIEWTEFFSMCRNVLKLSESEQQLRAVFRFVDADGSGEASIEELINLVKDGRVEVQMPPEQREVAWHLRLKAAARRVAMARNDRCARCRAQAEYSEEVGRFVVACRSAAANVVHEVMVDPHGLAHDLSTGTSSASDPFPRRITKRDSMWPLVRPRFRADRVFLFDSIVLTVVGGIVGDNKRTQEEAWRLYQHDVKGMQALADAIASVECREPLVQPIAVLVDYLGFRVVCRPQVLTESTQVLEFVLGPILEARTAYGGPGDLPEIYRKATAVEQHVSLLLDKWDASHPGLRKDLGNVGEKLGLQGYPVALVSDLAEGTASTAVMRIRRTAGDKAEEEEYHFRTPAELLPPEATGDAQTLNPLRRLRREALAAVEAPPQAPTHSMASASAGYADPRRREKQLAAGPFAKEELLSLEQVAQKVVRDLPQQLLKRLGTEWPGGPPLDSLGWTEAFHAAGINMRYIGRVAAVASPPAQASLYREALARAAKWLLRKALWKRQPWVVLAKTDRTVEEDAPWRFAATEAVRIFNLALGGSKEAVEFWNKELVPEAVVRFGVPAGALVRRLVLPRALFYAMQHHCGVQFQVSAGAKPFFHGGYPVPISEEDLSTFVSPSARVTFPKRFAVQVRWRKRLQTRSVPAGSAEDDSFRGFFPRANAACARGPEWRLATMDPSLVVQAKGWKYLVQVRNLKLTLTRAFCDPAPVTGSTLQEIAVALLETYREAEVLRQKTMSINQIAAEIDGDESGADFLWINHAVWSADVAFRLLPSPISAWWSQIVAAECEWLLERFVEADSRICRMRTEWERSAKDQPVLSLRLESAVARLHAGQGDWVATASQYEKCIELAGQAFGISHPAVVALHARLGDTWARRQDWPKAAKAYGHALECAIENGDEMIVARMSFELAKVHHFWGDLRSAKDHAERAVSICVPRVKDMTNYNNETGRSVLECVHLLAQVYEDMYNRCQEDPSANLPHPPHSFAGLDRDLAQDLAWRAVQSYEAELRHLPTATAKAVRGGLTQGGLIVERVLRLKVETMGLTEKATLIEAIERLIMEKDLEQQDRGQTVRGVRAMRPRAETRAVAEQALKSTLGGGGERPERLVLLFEAVSRGSIVDKVDPSDWFDEQTRAMSSATSEGKSGSNEKDPSYRATVTLLDLCRYFEDLRKHGGFDSYA